MKMRFADAGSVRAVLDGGRRILEVLAVPFGGPERRDRLEQFFTARTNVWLAQGDRRPVLYMHGYSPQMRKMAVPPVMGTAEVVRQDEAGWWMQAEIDNSDLATRTWEAAKNGQARASTGSIAHLERHDEVTGEVLMWPVVELSVFDGGEKRIPVSDDAIVLPMRAIFNVRGLDLPEAFEAGEAEEAEEKDPPIDDEGDETMDEEEKIEAPVEETPEPEPVRAAVKPAKRAVFNVNKETVGTRGLTAEKQESHEWYWNLRHGIGPSMRVLEETEAAEILPMVPQDALNEIIALRDITSTASKIGIRRIPTERLIFNVPRESTAMTALAAIAEEGAYVANEPAFALLPLTVVKYGSMLTATEEALEDQALFQSWLNGAIARAWALAENTALFTEVKASGTQAVHSATFVDADIMTWFFAIGDPWRDGCSIVMDTTTMATMRAALIATPRAYGDFPMFGGGKYASFMDVPVVTDNNWEAVGGGDLFLEASMINPQAMALVERRGLKLFVDPYGDSLNGRIRYFPSVRFVFGTLQAVGVQNISDHA